MLMLACTDTPGMDVKEIRRLQLARLLRERGDQRQLAVDSETDESYLSQVRQGKRPMGDDLARRIEKARRLPHGWMDKVPTERPDTLSEEDVLNMLESISSIEAIDRMPARILVKIIKNLRQSGLRGEELRKLAETALKLTA
jgi:hypothetical protein